MMEYRVRDEINAREEGMEDMWKNPSIYLREDRKREFGRWLWGKTTSGDVIKYTCLGA